MLFVIWYQLYNLKNMKNTHRGELLLIEFHFLTYALLHAIARGVLRTLSQIYIMERFSKNK